jgi:hypothetical protein
MLKIKEGEPWIMWPNILGQKFIKDPANHIFDHEGEFSFRLVFELEEPITKKSTLFAKLPSYFGIDLEDYGILLIVTNNSGKTEYLTCNFQWEINKKYNLLITKEEDAVTVYIDGNALTLYFIEDKLAADPNSHIIFGAGNFPKNGFNLNYLGVTLHELEIIRDTETISKHAFEEFIHGKSYDLTDNCNFLHQI